MRALFASAVVVSSLALVPAAFAASMTTTGPVKSIDLKKHTLTLASGDTFILPKTFKDSDVKAGEKVKVAYQKAGKTMEAEMVTVIR